ncbi:SAM-dependent methyltransferase [Paenibacillus sp. BIHB 4019]|uniref:SAM-dependent methyltransferase n=1 Tax=Paenibacillus sp. BIHB 4019 TaxID=1870819 RepID=A0A1B2DCW7_9BACL|nr:class I SAM-dependent methyltransferase [Paenibacillus sp. BIHB 4019]ANY65564.1 SAM-dependent methyltransferase [Paenibacillus sp. BIHB 4019]
MNQIDYEAFYNEVGASNGWDFSRLKCISEEAKWDLYQEVVKLSRKTDLLLDIGTGGGEAILSIADCALLLVGIDLSTGMVNTAMKNITKAGRGNVRVLQMNADKLDFPDRFFQTVACRHSAFNAQEVARVLENGGTFLTQQVSEYDKLNLKQAFGRGQAYGEKPGSLKERYLLELTEAGFTKIEVMEWNVAEFYETAEDLIFLLKHTPIIPNFGRQPEDFGRLEAFIRDNKSEKGIKTNAERFMIKAQR